MNTKLANFLLKSLGWTAVDPVAPEDKCIILGVPHTSGWDFVISYLYYSAVGGKANVFVKKSFFVWPLAPLMRALGAVPVDRSKGTNLVVETIKSFNAKEHIHLAIAPEGTRKATSKWKLGFHTIARATGASVYLGYFDWKTKTIGRGQKFEISDDPKADLEKILKIYSEMNLEGKFPEKYTTGH